MCQFAYFCKFAPREANRHLVMVGTYQVVAIFAILFLSFFQANEIRRNVRQFCGFDFSKGDKEYEKKQAMLNKQVQILVFVKSVRAVHCFAI